MHGEIAMEKNIVKRQKFKFCRVVNKHDGKYKHILQIDLARGMGKNAWNLSSKYTLVLVSMQSTQNVYSIFRLDI